MRLAVRYPVQVMATLLVTVLLGFSQQANASTIPSETTVSDNVSAAASTDSKTLTTRQYEALKVRLDKSSAMHRAVSTDNGVKTFTYTGATGPAISLQFPVLGHAASPTLGAGGCGFLQLCIYLNPTDQEAVYAGAGAAISAAVCLIPAVGQAACVGTIAAVAAAFVYINQYGTCANEMKIRVLPIAGAPSCT